MKVSGLSAAGQQRPVASSRDSAKLLTDFALSDLSAAPDDVRSLAKTCLVDAVACAIFGARFPWTRAVAEGIESPAGCVALPGLESPTSAERAALIAGVAAHAFELDSLRRPGAGVHPGATVALPALAMAIERSASGEALIAAIIAGIEIMFRIGAATLHTAEARGFHAPGITGCFGSAIVAGRLMGLTPTQLESAMGLAASMSGGLLAFSKTGDGGMVKRLHLGRAAESGIVAAKLAARGFEAPGNILEAKFGVLDVFCERSDPELLAAGLGDVWETRLLCIKRYACHVTAQGPVETLRGWMAEGLDPSAIRSIRIDAAPKIAHVHSQKQPTDIALAQYSLPFMLAFSAFYDPEDPGTLSEKALTDPRILKLAQTILVNPNPARKGWAVRMEIEADTTHVAEVDGFLGVPERPLTTDAVRARFLRLAGQKNEPLLEALMDISALGNVSELPSLQTN